MPQPRGPTPLAVAGTLGAVAEKIPLGQRGRTLAADAAHPDPPLGVSDPCPLHGRLAF